MRTASCAAPRTPPSPRASASGRRRAYHRLIESGIGDIILADPGRVDGVTGVSEVIRALAAANRTFNAHSWAGALNTAASIHLTACAASYIVMELKPRPSPPQHDIVDEPIEQHEPAGSPYRTSQASAWTSGKML